MPSLTSVIPNAGGPVAAMVAHPDDETFGLGALLTDLASAGRAARVLCFAHGEASTISAAAELGRTRRREFLDAAEVLGVADTALLDLPDGGLEARPVGDLDAIIDSWLGDDTAALIVFEPHGVTGHPDHRAVTAAAERVADRRALAVVEWGLDPATTSRLHTQHGLHFHAIDDRPGVFDADVDRAAQLGRDPLSRLTAGRRPGGVQAPRRAR